MTQRPHKHSLVPATLPCPPLLCPPLCPWAPGPSPIKTRSQRVSFTKEQHSALTIINNYDREKLSQKSIHLFSGSGNGKKGEGGRRKGEGGRRKGEGGKEEGGRRKGLMMSNLALLP